MSTHREFQIVDQLLSPGHLNFLRPPDKAVLKGSEPAGGCMLLKTLIVDDEPVARKILREELESIEDVEIVGEADNGTDALEKIAACRPDLVLLDLQMPGMGGLDVVRKLKDGSHMPAIVIVTAHDKFAIQAFEAGA